MKKKILPLIIAAATAASAFTVSAAEGENLVVLGDSITTGYGLDGYVSGDNTSAADSFANRLSGQFSGYENLAVDGRTSAQLLASLSEEETSSALENADTAVISIGGNDLLQPLISAAQMSILSDTEFIQGMMDGSITEEDILNKMAETDMESIVQTALDSIDMTVTGDNINNILAGINEINPDCDIYILTVYNPYENSGDMGDPEEISYIIEELNDAITYYAPMYDNVTVVDVHTAFKGKAEEYTNILQMDIHPNKEGHSVIYDMLTNATQNNTAETPVQEPDKEIAEETVKETAGENVVYAPAPDNTESSPNSGNTSDGVYMGVMAAAFGIAFLMKKGSVK